MSTEKLGIYVHIPFCKSKCKYCAFVSSSDFSLQSDYMNALVREINDYDGRFGSKCDTVYIGGGTPSCLPKGALGKIFAAISTKFAIDDYSEITVECNPESVSERFISECKDCGVNRISMGLQSSDDSVLKNIGRIHTFSQYVSAVKMLSKNFDNISSDIILGLPGQGQNDVIHSIDTVAEYCSHLSVYALTVEAGTPLYTCGYSPDDDCIADLYELAYNKLCSLGYSRYEVSNFARQDKQSKHNLKYWQNMPYLGFGVAAHGYDGSRIRYAHGDDIAEYIKDQTPQYYSLSDKDRYNEYVMLALRTERGIVLDEFYETFGFSFLTENRSVLDKLVNDNYIILDSKRARIAPEYLFVMNGIIEDLMKD